MTGVDVEHTKALEAAATPGPWLYCTKTYDGMPLVVAEGYGFPAEPMRQTRGIVCHPEADAEFIAHARTAVPVLVAAVERVQAQVGKALEILDNYNHSDDGELPECAPEDRWRLYRDLLATLNPEALETKP